MLEVLCTDVKKRESRVLALATFTPADRAALVVVLMSVASETAFMGMLPRELCLGGAAAAERSSVPGSSTPLALASPPTDALVLAGPSKVQTLESELGMIVTAARRALDALGSAAVYFPSGPGPVTPVAAASPLAVRPALPPPVPVVQQDRPQQAVIAVAVTSTVEAPEGDSTAAGTASAAATTTTTSFVATVATKISGTVDMLEEKAGVVTAAVEAVSGVVEAFGGEALITAATDVVESLLNIGSQLPVVGAIGTVLKGVFAIYKVCSSCCGPVAVTAVE